MIRTSWPRFGGAFSLWNQSPRSELSSLVKTLIPQVVPALLLTLARPASAGSFFLDHARVANCFAAEPHTFAHHQGPVALRPEGGAFLCHEVAVIGGRIWSSADHRGADHEDIDECAVLAAKEGSQR